MKFNYLFLVVGLYVGFVSFMLFLALSSSNEEVNLVAKDYYERDLTYDVKMNGIKNANQLQQLPEVIFNENGNPSGLKFPPGQENATGQVTFFRPSDSRLDQKFSIATDVNGTQQLQVKPLAPGKWQANIEWQSNGISYYKELPLDI